MPKEDNSLLAKTARSVIVNRALSTAKYMTHFETTPLPQVSFLASATCNALLGNVTPQDPRLRIVDFERLGYNVVS